MDGNQPSVLVLGSRYDLSCDYVIAQLRKQGASYLRLNSEDLPSLGLALDPAREVLAVRRGRETLRLDAESIGSVFYRRPVFLRDYGEPDWPAFERFQRFQWSVFVRSLMLFDTCQWVNHPTATYFAEHKAIQLHTAFRLGFRVPETVVANDWAGVPSSIWRNDKIVAKGLDTVLLREGTTETFGFTHILDRESATDEDVAAAPVIFQEPIDGKTDIRVTVVGQEALAVSVTAQGDPIDGDWRRRKGDAKFAPHELPRDTTRLCIALVAELGLSFGAIDLVLRNGEYFFLEINPTGEWAWLVDSAGLPIDALLAGLLANPRSHQGLTWRPGAGKRPGEDR